MANRAVDRGVPSPGRSVALPSHLRKELTARIRRTEEVRPGRIAAEKRFGREENRATRGRAIQIAYWDFGGTGGRPRVDLAGEAGLPPDLPYPSCIASRRAGSRCSRCAVSRRYCCSTPHSPRGRTQRNCDETPQCVRFLREPQPLWDEPILGNILVCQDLRRQWWFLLGQRRTDTRQLLLEPSRQWPRRS